MFVLLIVLAYLLGGFPSAVIVGRLRGVDIRAHGDPWFPGSWVGIDYQSATRRCDTMFDPRISQFAGEVFGRFEFSSARFRARVQMIAADVTNFVGDFVDVRIN